MKTRQKSRKLVNALVGSLATLGSIGCGDYLNPPLRDVTRGEFDNFVGNANLAYPIESDSVGKFLGREAFIRDLDGDDQADIIFYGPAVYWMAPGIDGEDIQYFRTTPRTMLMTPEIREAATRALKADRDLAYLTAKENYRLGQERERNEENQ